MTFNPEAAVQRLRSQVVQVGRTQGEARATAMDELQRAIDRAELEATNLWHQLSQDPAKDHLYHDLIGHIELGKAILRQADVHR